MPRRPRLHVPGGLFHIVLRGNGHQDIFFDDQDRRLWEQFLQAALTRYSHRIHAYSWMTNHVHMAIQAHTMPLARFIGTLASRYAKAVNKKLGRSGHLFERRYRSTIVQAESYLKELVRYIDLNPVRAGMVNDPADYPWSSHIAYLGRALPPWLTRDWVLAAFGPMEKSATQCYAKFMQGTQSDYVAGTFRASPDQDDRILGDDGFLESVARPKRSVPATETLDEIILAVCRKHDVTEADIASSSRSRLYARIRAEIALEALDRRVSSVTEVARRFGRCQPSLSRTMGRLRDRQANR